MKCKQLCYYCKTHESATPSGRCKLCDVAFNDYMARLTEERERFKQAIDAIKKAPV